MQYLIVPPITAGSAEIPDWPHSLFEVKCELFTYKYLNYVVHSVQLLIRFITYVINYTNSKSYWFQYKAVAYKIRSVICNF